jgi:hypothetical protein
MGRDRAHGRAANSHEAAMPGSRDRRLDGGGTFPRLCDSREVSPEIHKWP